MTRRDTVWNPPPGAREWLRALLEDWVSGQTPDATAQQCPCRECGSTFAAASLVGRLESAAELDPEQTQALIRTLRQSRAQRDEDGPPRGDGGTASEPAFWENDELGDCGESGIVVDRPRDDPEAPA